MKLLIPGTEFVLQQTGLQKPCLRASVIGDSTLAVFRRPVCLKLRQLGYDVCRFQSRSAAWENQIAVDITISPKVDLCLALPNGNRLAGEAQSKEPHWLRSCCENIGGALQCVAKRATVFVGHASLSPGVPHAEAYKVLVPIFHNLLKVMGVSLVSEATGVILEPDGIHWNLRSQSAVANLIERMVTAATNPSAFPRLKPPNLWHWRFNSTCQKHYPCCTPCNKDATDWHLNHKIHQHHANGSLASFDFPDRLRYCADGVKFFIVKGTEAALDTTPILPAEHPLPRQPSSDKPNLEHAVAFTVEQQGREPLSPKSCISQKCTINLHMTGGEPESGILCSYIAHGQARDAFAVHGMALAFKSQKMSRENRNKNEWEIYNNTPILRQFLPQVFGYFEQDFPHERLSFLLLAKVSFTFAEMMSRLVEDTPTIFACMTVLRCSERVLNTLVEAARLGIKCHDWHTGNIGFMDEEASHMKLVDWEGNEVARTSQSYSDRIDKAINSFLRYLPGQHTYLKTQVFAELVASKTPEVQINMTHWRIIMTEMSEKLQGWWELWKEGAKADDLPSSEQLTSLIQTCTQVAVERVVNLPPQLPLVHSTSTIGNLAHGQDARLVSGPSSANSTIAQTVAPTTVATRIPTAPLMTSVPTRPIAASQAKSAPARMDGIQHH